MNKRRCWRYGRLYVCSPFAELCIHNFTERVTVSAHRFISDGVICGNSSNKTAAAAVRTRPRVHESVCRKERRTRYGPALLCPYFTCHERDKRPDGQTYRQTERKTPRDGIGSDYA